MSISPLFGRSFLKLLDYSPDEIRSLLDLSSVLKQKKRNHSESKHLLGKNVALIFEKASTRTRCAFEVACFDQGAHCTYLGPTGSQLGKKETVADTARVLGRYYDGIEYRGFAQETVETLGRMSGVPVWNGLTDQFHPTQILATMLTIRECLGVNRIPKGTVFCYVGDARNNMGNSLLVGCALLGLEVRICAPRELWPAEDLVETVRGFVEQHQTDAKIVLESDVDVAMPGCQFVYTDVWVSMGEPEEVWEERIRLLKPYQVSVDMLRKTGNYPDNVKFMHCLPSFHNADTKVGASVLSERFGLEALEVTDEVFESPCSTVFDEAENRLHTIKAVMVATLNRGDILKTESMD